VAVQMVVRWVATTAVGGGGMEVVAASMEAGMVV
nr:hypothetical protein [Tanacetum cinerariifolium]